MEHDRARTFVLFGRAEHERRRLLDVFRVSATDEARVGALDETSTEAYDMLGVVPTKGNDSTDLYFHDVTLEDTSARIIETRWRHDFDQHTLSIGERAVSVHIEDTPENHHFAMSLMMGASQAAHGVCITHISVSESQLTGDLFLLGMVDRNHPLVLIDGVDLVDYEKDDFERTAKRVRDRLKHVGTRADHVECIPIVTANGENIHERSSNMPWYDGPSVEDALLSRIESLRE